MESEALVTRIHSELFELMSDTQLRKHLLISSFFSSSNPSIHVRLRHFVSRGLKPLQMDIEIAFPASYPCGPPSIQILPNPEISIQIPQIISKCSLIQYENWNQKITIKQILLRLLSSLGIFWEGLANFDHSLQLIAIKKQPARLSHGKNYSQVPSSLGHLQMILLKRFEQISKELKQKMSGKPIMKIQQIIGSCKRGQIGFEDAIGELMQDTNFGGLLLHQIENGIWINKILKSPLGIIYKKMLIGYSSELLCRIKELSVQSKAEFGN